MKSKVNYDACVEAQGKRGKTMELEVISIENVGRSIEIEVLNRQTREIVKITPYQLMCGIILNDAPVVNASASLNSVIIDINGNSRMITVKVNDNVKAMFRAKLKEKRRNEPKISAEAKRKQAEIQQVVTEYREREAARKQRMKEVSKDFAKPGTLTLEERRRRRQAYYGIKGGEQ